MVPSGQTNAQVLELGNKCSVKLGGTYYEFHILLKQGGRWIVADQLNLNVTIGSASQSFTATNAQILQKQFTRWELGWNFPGIALLGWQCQKSCVSGSVTFGGFTYSNAGYCID